jgi:phage host-nuclease inhibitor protein Gam
MGTKKKIQKPLPMPSKETAAIVPAMNEAGAENILRQIGRLENSVAKVVAREREKILAAQKKMADETAQDLADIAVLEKALEQFAVGHKDELFTERKRSIRLACGDFGIKWEKPYIELLVDEETVVNRIKASKEFDNPEELIHRKEMPNLVRLIDYENDVLKPLGLTKKQGEKFWYKVRPEVK